mmetsp:Transcript_4462/g.6024  ORF Transcript_4462/g.6024 Transcript_4462/m.6024 type:complete len:384 (+) Transcript_4462:262-1413(+)
MGSPVDTAFVAKLQSQHTMGGPLGVYVGVQLSPQPIFSIEKRVPAGSGLFVARAEARAETLGELGEVKAQDVRIWLDWRPILAGTSIRLEEPIPGLARLRMKQSIDLSLSSDSSTLLSVGGSLDIPTSFRDPPPVTAPPMRRKNFTPKEKSASTTLDFVKLRVRGGRSVWPPAPGNRRERARRMIAIVAGHWIDPGSQIGAPGERQFNMQIANSVTSQLRSQGWTVLRPELDPTPHSSWDAYLGWVRAQTRLGTPLIEVHGQGGGAAVKRHGVLGVLGRRDAILCQELQKGFNWFPMDWQSLAIPRSGGAILEAFNTDKINKMSRWRKQLEAYLLTTKIVRCIEFSDKRIFDGFTQGKRLVKEGFSSTGIPIRDTEASHLRHT